MTPLTEVRAGARSAPHARAGRLPGDAGMWVFVLGDLVIFAGYFVVYTCYRARDPVSFLAAQQHLNLTVGAANTIVLLTSSWFVARAVQAVRRTDHAGALRLVGAGAGAGLGFIAIKGCEWSSELRRGLTLSSDDFFMFYYMLTGVHLFHVLLGLIILAVVARELRDERLRRPSVVEAGATYWHLVDLLWIVIFALLYVMR